MGRAIQIAEDFGPEFPNYPYATCTAGPSHGEGFVYCIREARSTKHICREHLVSIEGLQVSQPKLVDIVDKIQMNLAQFQESKDEPSDAKKSLALESWI